MSKLTTKTGLAGLTALLILTAAAPGGPAAAQEAIMLETHGFVRMAQPDEARRMQVPQPQQSTAVDERQHASAF